MPTDPVVIDIGPALLKARQSVCVARGVAGGGSSCSRAGPLTTSHPAVRHLESCEQRHCWRWVPDRKLSALWQELSPQDRARVVETHVGGSAVRRFCKDMAQHVRLKECRACEKSKRNLGAVFMLDQHSLSIYKEMFVVAVEQNVPVAINMHVIEAVDSVVQDYCDSRQRREGRQTDYVDPRLFPEGSELWVQYREREHVRLLWMSTMARVFELRLLELWESRHGAEDREAARQASLRAAMELLQLEEGGRSGGRASGSDGAGSPNSLVAPGGGLKERRRRQRQRKRQAAKAAAGEAAGELMAAEAALALEQGDEIDAEFNRRVLEHLRSRAEEAKSQGPQAQTERGNEILKALCQKLKAQLEDPEAPSRPSKQEPSSCPATDLLADEG